MRNYHDYEKAALGASDIAALVFVGCREDEGAVSQLLRMGSDGHYQAYIVDGDAEIGEHYHEVAAFTSWVKVYDDEGLTFSARASHITVYRGGEMGLIIRLEDDDADD